MQISCRNFCFPKIEENKAIFKMRVNCFGSVGLDSRRDWFFLRGNLYFLFNFLAFVFFFVPFLFFVAFHYICSE